MAKGKAGRDCHTGRALRKYYLKNNFSVRLNAGKNFNTAPNPEGLFYTTGECYRLGLWPFGHAQLRDFYIPIFFTFQQQYPNYLKIFTFTKEAKSCNKLRIVFNM